MPARVPGFVGQLERGVFGQLRQATADLAWGRLLAPPCLPQFAFLAACFLVTGFALRGLRTSGLTTD